jgi:predicted dehydrogenase
MRRKIEMVDARRRKTLSETEHGAVASEVDTTLSGLPKETNANARTNLRWGFVGTGSIAGSMATMIREADSSSLVAVSSRRMETARTFAAEHTIANAFDSWSDMIASEEVDAIYVATPTSIREEICIAAAKHGKHVLAEKPFANMPSLQRIVAACRANGVGFMDGTHFTHHPRTAAIRAATQDQIGWVWSLDSTFQFNLADRGNIRYKPKLEPLGAIGDAGWYNMRAMIEYLPPDIELRSVNAYLRRDGETGAAVGGSGVMLFDDGSTSTWNCGFDSGAVKTDLRLSGAKGVVSLDDFISNGPDASASYTCEKGPFSGGSSVETTVESDKTGPALMFEAFASMIGNNDLFEQSVRRSQRTQGLLDGAWNNALMHEKNHKDQSP